MIRNLIATIVALLIIPASPAKTYPAMPQETQGPYTVIKVVDGDTLWINNHGERQDIRAIGLNTPEIVDPHKPVQCFGREASEQAESILNSQQVYLETDPSQGTTDKYGRILAYIWTASRHLFNLDMIIGGYGVEYTYNLPYRYQAEFKAAEKGARTEKRGLWGACK